MSAVVITRKLHRIHGDRLNSHQLLQSQRFEHPGGLLNNVKLDHGSGLWSVPLSARQIEQTIKLITSEFWIWTFQSATVKSLCCVTSLWCSTEKDFCCFSSLLLLPVGYSLGINNSFILCEIYNFYSQPLFIWFLSVTVEKVSERTAARSEWLSVFSSDISRRRPDLSSGFSRLLATAQHTTETVNTHKAALCSLPWWQTSL